MKRLHRKVCIITGGAGGIGFAAVERFLLEGACVVLADLNEELGREKTELAAAQGYRDKVRFCSCDISDENQVEEMMRFAVSEFGRLDSIFNNAGIGGAFGPLTDIRVRDWDRTLSIVLRGTFLCVKHAARTMQQQNSGGSIVNNASVVAHVGDSAGAAYAAAKAGILSLTYFASRELSADRIRVNSVSPGTIVTPLLHRGGNASELEEAAVGHQPWPIVETGYHVAATAAFLASDEAKFLTGEEVFVDGGASAAGPGYASAEGGMRELLMPFGEKVLDETATHVG